MPSAPLALLTTSSRFGKGLGFSEQCVKATATHGPSISLLLSFHLCSPADADLRRQTYFFSGRVTELRLKSAMQPEKGGGQGKRFVMTELDWRGGWFSVLPQKSWDHWPTCNKLTTVSLMSRPFRLRDPWGRDCLLRNASASPSKPEPSLCVGALVFFKENKVTANQGGKHKHGALTFLPQARKITKWACWACFLPALGEATVLFFYSSIFGLVNLEVWEMWFQWIDVTSGILLLQ